MLRPAAPNHDAAVGRKADHRHRHGVEDGGQRLPGLALGLLEAHALGDVLVDGDPAVVEGRPSHDGHRAPADELVGLDRGLRHGAEPLGEIGLAVADEHAGIDAVLEDVADQRAGTGQLWRQGVDLCVALVAHHQAALAVDHGEPVRHVGERHVEAQVLRAQLRLRRISCWVRSSRSASCSARVWMNAAVTAANITRRVTPSWCGRR
jgi:hypothetical protein